MQAVPKSVFLIVLLAGLGLVACGSESTATPPPTLWPTPTVALTTANNQPVPGRTAVITLAATPPATTFPSVAATASPLPSLTLRPLPLPTVGTVGDLPAPANTRPLNLTVAILQRAKNIVAPDLKVDLASLTIGAFAADGTASQPADFFDYYRQTMQTKGWVESQAYTKRLGIYFTKGRQVAAVAAIGVPDAATVAFLATFAPEIRSQIQGGDILILLGQGPATTFEVLKSNK